MVNRKMLIKVFICYGNKPIANNSCIIFFHTKNSSIHILISAEMTSCIIPHEYSTHTILVHKGRCIPYNPREIGFSDKNRSRFNFLGFDISLFYESVMFIHNSRCNAFMANLGIQCIGELIIECNFGISP